MHTDLIPTLRNVPSIRKLVIYAQRDHCHDYGDDDDELYDYSGSLVEALIKRDRQGVLELVPSLQELVIQTYSVGWAEALVNGRNGRNNEQPEQCKMQFTLHLPRDSPWSEEFPAFRRRHAWSVDNQNASVFSDMYNRTGEPSPD